MRRSAAITTGFRSSPSVLAISGNTSSLTTTSGERCLRDQRCLLRRGLRRPLAVAGTAVGILTLANWENPAYVGFPIHPYLVLAVFFSVLQG